MSSKIVELFGIMIPSTDATREKVRIAVEQQKCPYNSKTCIKTRKSESSIAIGTCVVTHATRPVIICPHRMLEERRVFTDCIHLLTHHKPGNDFHVVPEVKIPGGVVDYFLVSSRSAKVRDFVGIEIQTLDTTGTVWPERQRLLRDKGLDVDDADVSSAKSFGVNWKMTAKTILLQLHHKVESFALWNRHLVLVVQDALLRYIQKEFATSHLDSEANVGDPMHIHAYRMNERWTLELAGRLSTDVAGVASALHRESSAPHSFADIVHVLEQKIGKQTRFVPA